MRDCVFAYSQRASRTRSPDRSSRPRPRRAVARPGAVRAAADVDLEVAVALAPGRGDEQPVADPPAHDAAVGVHLVLGRVEAQQHERGRSAPRRARPRRVGDADEPERHAREVLPVGAREALEVHRRPDRVELLLGHDEVGGLDRAHRARCSSITSCAPRDRGSPRWRPGARAGDPRLSSFDRASAARTASSKPSGVSLIPGGGGGHDHLGARPSTSG